MRQQCCLRLNTISLGICILYLLIHGALLALLIVTMTDPEELLGRIMETVDTTDHRLQNSRFYDAISRYVVEGQQEYFAVPITITVVLIVSNILAAAGSVFSQPALLLPWLGLYLLLNLLVCCLLVYCLLLLQDGWLQTIIFLVVTPLIMLAGTAWAAVLRLLLGLRSAGRKLSSPDSSLALPATVYSLQPGPPHWDSPLPIWALSPPRTVWDPVYLQQHDPRYRTTPTPSTRLSQPRSLLSSSELQDSLSLSSKYAGDRTSLAGGEEEEDQDMPGLSSTVEVKRDQREYLTVLTELKYFQLIPENTKNFDIQGSR